MGSSIRFLAALVLFFAIAVSAAPTAPDATLHVAATEVDAAFARGAPLVERDAYKIHASRRDAAGEAEVHTSDTDLIYVREGRAIFVTGGRVVEPVEIAQDEIRGTAIAGGTTRELAAGDVVVVPHGTPHWFRSVRAPFVYYVVKVTDGAAR